MHSPLPKSLQRYADRIADYTDERSDDNPIFISYTSGWRSWTDLVGIVHADTAINVCGIDSDGTEGKKHYQFTRRDRLV